MVVEHDVLWFQVSVDDSFLMQMAQCHGYLCQVETKDDNRHDAVSQWSRLVHTGTSSKKTFLYPLPPLFMCPHRSNKKYGTLSSSCHFNSVNRLKLNFII